MSKQLLLTPGPTPIPEDIQKIMSKPIIHHRTPQFKEIFAESSAMLKKIFKTEQGVITFASSGTGAMEASVANVLSKSDKAIVVRGGKFGERFAEICKAYGVKVINIDIEWGQAPDPEDIKRAFDANEGIKAVYLNLCETSTATVYDIKKIAAIVKETDAILVVDVISGLGSDEFKMDEWSVDIAVGGSQKGLMLPPGLAFCAISQKAWGMVDKSTLPKFYFDFKQAKKMLDKNDTPWTPAITLVIGLKKSLSLMAEAGFDNFINTHKKNAEYLRKEIKQMGLGLFSKSPSDAVTAVKVPDGIDGLELVKTIKANGVTVAGGQAALKGKIIRIAHMGSITRKDLDRGLTVIKDALKTLGYKN